MECARPRDPSPGAAMREGNLCEGVILSPRPCLRPRTAALRKICTSILELGKRRDTVSRAGTSGVGASKFRAPKNQRDLQRPGQILMEQCNSALLGCRQAALCSSVG